MYSFNDENIGTVKTDWESVRQRVMKVEPRFASIVDKLSPGKDFPLYLVYFAYGDFKGDAQSSFMSDMNGGQYRLTDSNIPSEINKDLDYGKRNAPLGLLLEKNMELFWDIPDENITIPKLIYEPGNFMSIVSNIIMPRTEKQYTSNKIYSMTAGGRSVFMLPSIGSANRHSRLQSYFNVKSPPPKSLYEEWMVFKEIAHSKEVDNNWKACILYFSEKWIEKLHNDQAWQSLKVYLYEKGWGAFQYDLACSNFESAFSMIQKKRNLKPNPYLADTARHLFSICMGNSPGYAPACDEETLPLSILQRVFVEKYGLKKYYPTIMQPQHFSCDQDTYPVYYSLYHPSTYIFSPKSCKISSTLKEMRELEYIVSVFKEELNKENTICSDTILGEVSRKIDFKYYHNELDKHNRILPSSEIINFDPRFSFTCKGITSEDAQFSADACFLRGCVSLGAKS